MDNKAASMLRKKYGPQINKVTSSGQKFIKNFKQKLDFNKSKKPEIKFPIKDLEKILKPKK